MKKIFKIFLAIVFLSVFCVPLAHSDLFVSSSDGNIYRYNGTDDFVEVIPELSDPRQLVIAPDDPDGYIYVITYGDNKVQRYGYDGEEYVLTIHFVAGQLTKKSANFL